MRAKTFRMNSKRIFRQQNFSTPSSELTFVQINLIAWLLLPTVNSEKLRNKKKCELVELFTRSQQLANFRWLSDFINWVFNYCNEISNFVAEIKLNCAKSNFCKFAQEKYSREFGESASVMAVKSTWHYHSLQLWSVKVWCAAKSIIISDWEWSRGLR